MTERNATHGTAEPSGIEPSAAAARQSDPPPTPEDVAGLYSWANVNGTRYRDFSASREKLRAGRRAPDLPLPSSATAPAPPEPLETSKVTTMPLERLSTSSQPAPRLLPQRPSRRAAPATPEPRWVALNSVLDQYSEHEQTVGPRDGLGIPAIAFASLAGGVGKTSLLAALGCLLAKQGDSSLLVDTHLYGLLSLFFGAREIPPGSARTFSSSAHAAPIRVMKLALDLQSTTVQAGVPAQGEPHLGEQIRHHAEEIDRVLVDVSTASTALLREVLGLPSTLLVVLTPDLTSIVSLQSMLALLQQIEEETKHAAEVYFLLNHFDASLRLHLDIRERLIRQLGERLLPFVIHRSGAFSEALAEGMTVVDYAPEAQVVKDLHSLAHWVQELNQPEAAELPALRWRER